MSKYVKKETVHYVRDNKGYILQEFRTTEWEEKHESDSREIKAPEVEMIIPEGKGYPTFTCTAVVEDDGK